MSTLAKLASNASSWSCTNFDAVAFFGYTS